MLKRAFDFVFAGTLLVLLMPLLLVLAAIVRWRLGTPVLFQQVRPGLEGKPFRLYKFRTMTDERAGSGEFLPDAQRMTTFGIWLRSTSLDELPELWNVLRGDMSVVGPRPLLMEYLPLYDSRQMMRHAVRPGLTGWAQVNGRNAISWEEKFELDVWYVENRTCLLDMRIIWSTVICLFSRDGVTQSGQPTVSRYCGKQSIESQHK